MGVLVLPRHDGATRQKAFPNEILEICISDKKHISLQNPIKREAMQLGITIGSKRTTGRYSVCDLRTAIDHGIETERDGRI